MAGSKRHDLVARVAAWLSQGKQACCVCPLIQESELLQAQTATDTFQALSEALTTHKIGLVHGQMKSSDKVSAIGRERLNVMRSSTDGFYIAQKDLELRGPGEFLGARLRR